MANFFKTFLKGILYVITFPLLVLGLAIYFVISLFSFIFLSIKGLVLFFKGESIVGDMKEDIEAKKRLDALMDPIGTLEKIKQEQNNNQTITIEKEVVSEQNNGPYVQLIQDSSKEEEIINKANEIVSDFHQEEKIVDILEPNEDPINEEDIPYNVNNENAKKVQESINKDINNNNNNNKIEEISIQNNQKPFFESFDEEEENDYDSGVTIEGFDDGKK